MNPERWPGEPLIERLTIDERNEVQASNVRRWLGQKRRDRYEITHGRKQPVKRYDAQGRRVG
jgi:hypothetical protein